MTKDMKRKYNKQLDIISHRDIEQGQIVLLGDCIMENIDMAKYFQDMTIYNNSLSGDTTTTLQQTLYKRAIKYKPSKLFLSIGLNDIADETLSVKEIYNNIVAILTELKRRTRDTEVILVTLLPVHPSMRGHGVHERAKDIDNIEVEMLNYYLKNYARRKHLRIVDAYKHLKNDFDQLHIQYTSDGFHLNEKGYDLYTSLIRQHA